ncbi:metallophosphoesterase [Pseudomonas sp. DWP3-1-2]|uniref:metallophosphoesterase n=1 Tax=Pseudomonas sp. DWP3-1-2 TaxID=2804645 RepID=UPI003CF28229
MSKFQHVDANPQGRDFAVGDIHGHFTRLQAALDAVEFDPAVDRLFSVGDLVDRGPQSEQALDWLAQPWFFAIQGNHESLAIQHALHQPLDYRMYKASGGSWFLELKPEAQKLFAAHFARLPLALEVETSSGLIGLVHADCPLPTWDLLRSTLLGHLSEQGKLEEYCLWSRERLQMGDMSGIPDLRALIVGHTTLPQPHVLGNVFHIDTGGWRSGDSGYFTLLDLATLQVNPPIAAG